MVPRGLFAVFSASAQLPLGAPAAEVYGYNATANKTVPGETDGEGGYELNLDEGSWIVYTTDDACFSEDTELSIEACEEYEVPLEIIDCDTADKPNLYLDPEQDTPMAVRLHHTDRQAIVASAPRYPAGEGWTGVAHPDGTWSAEGECWPFLFYEVSVAPWQGARFQRQAGWCVPEAGAARPCPSTGCGCSWRTARAAPHPRSR